MYGNKTHIPDMISFYVIIMLMEVWIYFRFQIESYRTNCKKCSEKKSVNI